jgi:cobalt-zinc-cadmium efflux system membrane fusion protein
MNKIAIIICVIFIASCHSSVNVDPEADRGTQKETRHYRKRNRKGQEQSEPAGIISRGDTIFIPLHSSVRSKLKLTSIEYRDYDDQYTTTGVVRPLSGHRADITSPFEGRIVRSFVRLGQKVSTGTPLFEVSSSEYLEYVRVFLQSRNERDLAEKNTLRKKELFDSGVSSRKELDESQLAFSLADKEFRKAEAMLKILNLDPENADLAQPLIVRSPLSGEVVRAEITVGQYLKTDSEPVMTVADIDNIWVVANVKEKDLASVSMDDKVEVYSEILPDTPVPGIVEYIGNIMNPETRSVEVFIRCRNSDHRLKCGMFVTVKFYHRMSGTIVIPADAVLQDNIKSYLFVQAGPDTFIKKEVTVTSAPGKQLIVRSGLKSGDVIVSEGSIYLR